MLLSSSSHRLLHINVQAAELQETKSLHAELNLQINKLKVALANETASLETERNAHWEVSKQR